LPKLADLIFDRLCVRAERDRGSRGIGIGSDVMSAARVPIRKADRRLAERFAGQDRFRIRHS
jgi:hypothetical protein